MARRRYCVCVLCALAAALLAALVAAPSARAADGPVSFIADVAPVLQENCFACHDARKKSGKFDMTTFEKLLAGGSNGDPVVPGKPAESDLHELMVSTDGKRMPPKDKGDPVPKEKAAVVAKWIAEGAKLDAGIDPKADLVKELRRRWMPPAPEAKYARPCLINALCFTPDGKQIVVGQYHELTVWDPAGGKLLKRISTRTQRAYGLAFLPDGTLAVAGGFPGKEGDVRVYDLDAEPAKTVDDVAFLDGVHDPKVLEQTIENHADWVLGVTFTADGKYLLTAGRDKTAKVWDLKAKESVMTFPDHQSIVYAVAAKPDGSLGISVGGDKQVRTWKPGGEGKQVKAAAGHGDEVFKAVFSPKENLFATASADKSVRLWDPDRLNNPKVLAGLSDYVYAVAFRPDGKQVAAGGFEGVVKVWTVADGKVVHTFTAAPGYRGGDR